MCVCVRACVRACVRVRKWGEGSDVTLTLKRIKRKRKKVKERITCRRIGEYISLELF